MITEQMATIPEDYFYNVTETYNPRYRKGEFKHLLLNKRNKSSPAETQKLPKIELDETILHNFKALGGYISNLDELFRARMTVHEEEIIQIAHSELKKIQQESQNIIKRYSDLIRAKNISSEILDLKYEVKYYQKRACQMFEENKQLKRQLKTLQNKIDIIKLEEESSHLALKNVSKKYLKEKTIRRNIEIGGLKRMLVKESSGSNIKITMLSQSQAHINPQKQQFQSKIIHSPKRQDSTASRNEGFFSMKRQANESKHSNDKRGSHARNKTQPARQILPIINQK